MQSSIVKKFLMAISGIFLIIFLTQHLFINLTSLVPDDGKTFNLISHFMGYNPVVQFILQPLLIFGVCFHFIMGFALEISNRSARSQKYLIDKTEASWVSKNMIISGMVIFSFLLLHFYDFWIPEINYKYIDLNGVDSTRYFEELVHKFEGNIYRTLLYCVSFVFLGLHLLHGFTSSFQTMGIQKKYLRSVQLMSTIYSYSIMLGFILIAIIHYCN